MDKVVFGLVCGLVFGILDVLIMAIGLVGGGIIGWLTTLFTG